MRATRATTKIGPSQLLPEMGSFILPRRRVHPNANRPPMSTSRMIPVTAASLTRRRANPYREYGIRFPGAIRGTVRTRFVPETEALMTDAFIVGAVRTPIGKRNGGLAGVHPVDLAAHALRALVDRTGVDPGAVDDVIMGCV